LKESFSIFAYSERKKEGKKLVSFGLTESWVSPPRDSPNPRKKKWGGAFRVLPSAREEEEEEKDSSFYPPEAP